MSEKLSEIIRQHDERRISEGNRAGVTIGGCRLSKAEVMGLGGNGASKTKMTYTMTTGLQWPEDYISDHSKYGHADHE